jgi:hypothetical protein
MWVRIMRTVCGLLTVLMILGPIGIGMLFNVDAPLLKDDLFTTGDDQASFENHGTRSPPSPNSIFLNLYFHSRDSSMNTSNIAHIPGSSGGGRIVFTLQDPLIRDLIVEKPSGEFPMMANVYIGGTGSLTVEVRDNSDSGPLLGSATYGPFVNANPVVAVPIYIPLEAGWGESYTFSATHLVVIVFDFVSYLRLYCTPIEDIEIKTYNFYDEPVDLFYPNNIDFPDERKKVKVKGVVSDVLGKRDKKYIGLVQVQIQGPGNTNFTEDASWDKGTSKYSYTWQYLAGQAHGEYNVTAHVFDEQDHEFTVITTFNMSKYGALLTSPSQVGGEGSYAPDLAKAKRNVVENSIITYHINVWNIGNFLTGLNITTAGPLGWNWWLKGENLTSEYQKTGEISSLAPGTKKGIKLAVDAMDNPPGSKATIIVTAKCLQDPLEDSFLTTITTVVMDTTIPNISDVSTIPPSQNVYGSVNISARVFDDFGIYGVWVNITSPTGEFLNNYSMIYDSFRGKYYQNFTYSILGTYNFTIWTNDTSNNWNSYNGQFIIQDNTPPSISDIQAIPSPQEVYNHVNISVLVQDNYQLFGVWLKIIDPAGETFGNFSMIFDAIDNKHYHDSSYSTLGTHSFVIWANDTSHNWNSTEPTPLRFIIQDKTIPTITNQADPSLQEIGEKVNITAIVTDNVDVEEVWVQILKPDENELENITMNRVDSADYYWYNRTFSDIGDYEYKIWAKDGSDNWAYAEGIFIIQDTTPPIPHVGSDLDVLQGKIIIFNGSASSDKDGIENYTWSFIYNGETVTLYSIYPTFKFEIIGNYTVTLKVMDPSGNSASDTMWVNVTGIDSDEDGLTDYDEEHIYSTDPKNPDSDGDGSNDGDEIEKGTDPLIFDKTEEKSVFEGYWWLFLIIAVIVVIIVLLWLLFLKGKEN